MVSAKKSDLTEGQLVVLQGNGSEIVVANVGGRFVAFDNVCSHAGGPLSLGELAGNVIECPWHGARFDVFSGAPIDGTANLPIAVYEVKIEGDSLRVGSRRSSANKITTFQNDIANYEIVVNVHSFSCVGAAPPHDHPRIHLKVDIGGEIVCPYCQNRFRHDPDAMGPPHDHVVIDY